MVTSQYGQAVTLWGHGIYARDLLFKAAGFIGTDLIILAFFVPLFLYTVLRVGQMNERVYRVRMSALYASALYYAACQCFGVTCNRLILVYIALFGLSFFGMMQYTGNQAAINLPPTCGLKIFLIILGIALCAAAVSFALQICLLAGLMITAQSVFQYLSGIDIPLPVLISKVLIFAVLSFSAFVLQRKWYAGMALKTGEKENERENL